MRDNERGRASGDYFFDDYHERVERARPLSYKGSRERGRPPYSGGGMRRFLRSPVGKLAIGGIGIYTVVQAYGTPVGQKIVSASCERVPLPGICDEAIQMTPPKPIMSKAAFPSAVSPTQHDSGVAEYIIDQNINSFLITTTPDAATKRSHVTGISIGVKLGIANAAKLADMDPSRSTVDAAAAISAADWVYWMSTPKTEPDKSNLHTACQQDLDNVVTMARRHAGDLLPPSLAPYLRQGESSYDIVPNGRNVDDPSRVNINVYSIRPSDKAVFVLSCK